MVTLDEMYAGADMMVIMAQHPNWDFYRNERGFLCCRLKKQKEKEANGSQRRSTSPQK